MLNRGRQGSNEEYQNAKQIDKGEVEYGIVPPQILWISANLSNGHFENLTNLVRNNGSKYGSTIAPELE